MNCNGVIDLFYVILEDSGPYKPVYARLSHFRNIIIYYNQVYFDIYPGDY